MQQLVSIRTVASVEWEVMVSFSQNYALAEGLEIIELWRKMHQNARCCQQIQALCRPVNVDAFDPVWLGTRIHTIDSGEVSAIVISYERASRGTPLLCLYFCVRSRYIPVPVEQKDLKGIMPGCS